MVKHIILVFTLLLPGKLLANNSIQTYISSNIKTWITLLVVIFLYLFFYYYKQKLSKKNKDDIEIINVKHIGFKNQLMMIKSHNTKILIGITGSSINKIYAFDERKDHINIRNVDCNELPYDNNEQYKK